MSPWTTTEHSATLRVRPSSALTHQETPAALRPGESGGIRKAGAGEGENG